MKYHIEYIWCFKCFQVYKTVY